MRLGRLSFAALPAVATPATTSLRTKSGYHVDRRDGRPELLRAGHRVRRAALGLGLASPRDSAVRGSQVSLTHEQGYAIVQALIARGITGDFRMPNILRFGFTPLYVSFANVYDTVQAIAGIMESGEWNQDKFLTKKAVT